MKSLVLGNGLLDWRCLPAAWWSWYRGNLSAGVKGARYQNVRKSTEINGIKLEKERESIRTESGKLIDVRRQLGSLQTEIKMYAFVRISETPRY